MGTDANIEIPIDLNDCLQIFSLLLSWQSGETAAIKGNLFLLVLIALDEALGFGFDVINIWLFCAANLVLVTKYTGAWTS